MVNIVGHRGARNLWPENSLLGFRKTAALPIEAVEFDVHQTSDNGLVVIHDALFERTAEASGWVGARTTQEACAVTLREAGGERVPTLDQVFDVFQDTKFELHIELKTDHLGRPYPGMEARIIELVRRRKLEDRAILTCFAPEILETIRKIWPQGRILASLDRRSAEMLGGIEPALARFQRIGNCLIAVERTLLAQTQELCLAKVGGPSLGAWVPNEKPDIAHWLAQPIRAITTDRPDIALEVRKERKEK